MAKDIHDNSTKAYHEQRARGLTTKYKLMILQLLADTETPMTDRQMLDALNEPDVNNVRPEVTRLKQAGIITEVDRVICPQTGKRVRRTMLTSRCRPVQGELKL